jgi:rubrerythrin
VEDVDTLHYPIQPIPGREREVSAGLAGRGGTDPGDSATRVPAKENIMRVFDANDVIRFAVRIEEDGEAFYRKVAVAGQNEDVRDLFNFLADEEIQHEALFREMLSKLETIQPAETYDGEYAAYLSDYIDGKVVFTREVQRGITSDVEDVVSAVTFAMQREADSILYYHEAKQFVGEKHYSTMDKIIAEERKHFNKLSELRKKYV